MTDAAETPPLRPRRPSPALAAFLGWVVPGLGHAYVGRPGKGLFLFLVVIATYVGGLFLADFRCVSLERDPFWFAAQGVAAGPTALVAWLTRDLEIDRLVPTFDVGLLYVSVASLLNAVVVADVLGIVDDLRVEAALREAEEAGLRAAILPPDAGAPVPVTVIGAAPEAVPPPPAGSSPPGQEPFLPRADLPDFGPSP